MSFRISPVHLISFLLLTLCLPIQGMAKTSESSSKQTIVGKVISAKGGAYAQNQDKKRKLKRRSKVYQSDTIVTPENGKVQLRFTDGALLALGEKTQLSIAEYAFNDTKSDKVTFELIEGKLRTITGKIGKKNKKNYQMKTPVATIGIRGTHYVLNYCEEECVSQHKGQVKKGLYGGVYEGGIWAKNTTGDKGYGKDDFFYVADSFSSPETLILVPETLLPVAQTRFGMKSFMKQPSQQTNEQSNQTQRQSDAKNEQGGQPPQGEQQAHAQGGQGSGQGQSPQPSAQPINNTQGGNGPSQHKMQPLAEGSQPAEFHEGGEQPEHAEFHEGGNPPPEFVEFHEGGEEHPEFHDGGEQRPEFVEFHEGGNEPPEHVEFQDGVHKQPQQMEFHEGGEQPEHIVFHEGGQQQGEFGMGFSEPGHMEGMEERPHQNEFHGVESDPMHQPNFQAGIEPSKQNIGQFEPNMEQGEFHVEFFHEQEAINEQEFHLANLGQINPEQNPNQPQFSQTEVDTPEFINNLEQEHPEFQDHFAQEQPGLNPIKDQQPTNQPGDGQEPGLNPIKEEPPFKPDNDVVQGPSPNEPGTVDLNQPDPNQPDPNEPDPNQQEPGLPPVNDPNNSGEPDPGNVATPNEPDEPEIDPSLVSSFHSSKLTNFRNVPTGQSGGIALSFIGPQGNPRAESALLLANVNGAAVDMADMAGGPGNVIAGVKDPGGPCADSCLVNVQDAYLHDDGGDQLGVNWGRWAGEIYLKQSQELTINPAHVHYIFLGDITPASALPQTGTFFFGYVGGTTPTSSSGALGNILPGTGITVDFSALSASANINVGIDGKEMNAFGDAALATDDKTVFHLQGTCNGCSNNTLVGGQLQTQFVGPNGEGAAGPFNIISSDDGVTGVLFMKR